VAARTLEGVLEEGQRRGLVGPAPVEDHVRHAQQFAAALGDLPSPALDLGSGGGLPGLVLAAGSSSRWVLLDARRRSGTFLRWAVDELGLADRVEVLVARAEEVGRDDAHRGAYALVTARGFGPPAVVAECAAPLLQVGGLLAVSEPPDAPDRWPAAALAPLGLAPVAGAGPAIRVLRQERSCPEAYPRRSGLPAKRPLF
jgi:16S rRNA (guanine527-N7)-methyltransferase